MTRRSTGNMKGERYLGNTDKKEVHDLDNETSQCQINEIIEAGHDKPFETLTAAQTQGYSKGHYCLGE